MRVLETSLGKMTYPEYVTFAFNPNIIRIEGAQEVTFTITGGITHFIDTRQAFGGKVEIDISKYLQCLVNKDTPSMYVTVKCSSEGEASIEYLYFLVIWGALNVGETWNESRTVTWYKNLPFEFQMYRPIDATLKTRYDKTTYKDLTLDEVGVVKIDLAQLFPNATDFAVIRMDSEAGGVFDFSFDGTFGTKAATVINRFNVNECTDGVYLRWTDRHGWTNYYLFDEGEATQTDKALDTLNSVEENVYQYRTAYYQGKEAEKSMKIGAPLVDGDTFRQLMTLATSPNVELYVGDNAWIPVNVAPLTITKGNKPLNDMEFVLYYPPIMTQRL